MRRISLERDCSQVVIILSIVLLYFYISNLIKKTPFSFIILFLIFIIIWLLTIFFFYFLGTVSKKGLSLTSLIFTFTYTLLPTLIWFFANIIFYFVFPPPRTDSLAGRSFSIFFITFSLSLLSWKIILVYLALRFSVKQHFFRIIYFILLYLMILLPFSYLMYFLKIFRVPFI